MGVIQAKTVSDYKFRTEWIDPVSKEIVLPLWIAIQAIVEADLTGAKWATVAAMEMGMGLDVHLIDVEIYEGVVAGVRRTVAEFWRWVEERQPPAIDWERDSAQF